MQGLREEVASHNVQGSFVVTCISPSSLAYLQVSEDRDTCLSSCASITSMH
jgi:hypothetical protein